jgi:hypothetical protein
MAPCARAWQPIDGIGGDPIPPRAAVDYALAMLFGVAVMTLVQSGSRYPAGNDSPYHIAMALRLPEWGFIHQFPWLHWTIFRDDFVSHHHGFHVILSPFVIGADRVFGDAQMGGKAASVLMAGLTSVAFLWLLRLRDCARPLVWMFLLACLPWQFWMRLAFVRAPIVALPMLLLATGLALRGRAVALGVLGFAFVHVYGGAVLFPLIPVAIVGGHAVAGTLERRHATLLIATGVGLAAGFVIHPYFPANLAFMATQLFDTGLGAPRHAGGEWKPFDAWTLTRMSAPLAVIWLVVLVARLRSGRRMDATGIGLVLLQIAFLVLTLKARRFIEYWPVFALLQTADMARDAEFQALMPRYRKGLCWAAIPVGVAVTLVSLVNARSHTGPAHDYPAMGAAMAHLRSHSQTASIVFTDDWDTFPACFYFNQHNRFSVGLDPVFTESRWPQLWSRYCRITRGQARTTADTDTRDDPDRPVSLDDVRDEFQADYVLVTAGHRRLYDQLQDSDQFEQVFPAEHAGDGMPSVSVFRVVGRPAAAGARR